MLNSLIVVEDKSCLKGKSVAVDRSVDGVIGLLSTLVKSRADFLLDAQTSTIPDWSPITAYLVLCRRTDYIL